MPSCASDVLVRRRNIIGKQNNQYTTERLDQGRSLFGMVYESKLDDDDNRRNVLTASMSVALTQYITRAHCT